MRRLLLAAALLAAGCGSRSPEPPPPPPVPACTTWWRTGDAGLDGLLPLAKETLQANEREFAGRTGPVRGFGAGEAYPQIWIRDSATLVPIARWLYPRDRVASWLVEHLAHQHSDSSLNDWIAAGPVEEFRPWAPRAEEIWRRGPDRITADRNTTEADQESSAVLAAWELFELYGPIWLDTGVAGRPLLDRLDAALLSVSEGRRDTPTGLVVSALTADWGDVSPAHGDQRAIYLDEQTPRVGGLYTNAMALLAARRLAEMASDGARPLRARAWSSTADRMRIDLRNALYLSQRGYFRVHRPLPGPPPPRRVDLDAMLATGGNAIAARAGALDDAERLRLFDEIERRHQAIGAPVLGVTLIPPFPAGFFKHPILAEEGNYQNGGHWDWFAGRLALAMLEGGDAERGRAQVRALAGRAVQRRALHEWHTAAGEGRGSPRYAGSAGALASAVLEGVLGLDWNRDPERPLQARAVFQPRLGPGRARLEVCAPGEPARAGYDYRMTADAVRLDYRSTAASARIAILLPPGSTAAAVSLDGAPREAVEQAIGRDRYLLVERAPASGRLEARLAPR
jgi:hypothetical protein